MKFWISPVGLLFLSAVLLGAGCKKKQEAAGAPVLAPPDKVFSSGAQSEGQDIAPAEAEVKASSGPIELMLRIYQKSIKREKGALWSQILLRNIGNKKILLTDDAFLYPGAVNSRGVVGLTLQVLDKDGKRMDCAPFPSHDSGWPEPAKDSMDPEGDRKMIAEIMLAEGEKIRQREALWSELDKKRVSKKELFRRLHEFDEQHAHIGVQKNAEPKKSLWLDPGAIASTLPSAGEPDRIPKPVGNFYQCWNSQFWEPGNYRVRVRFDNLPSGTTVDYRKKHHLKVAGEDQILVQTPFIEVTVVP